MTLSSVTNEDSSQIRKHINVGEYGLALDDMTFHYTGEPEPVTATLQNLVNEAADLMALGRSPSIDDIAWFPPATLRLNRGTLIEDKCRHKDGQYLGLST